MINIKFLQKKWMWIIYAIMFGALIGSRIFAFFEPSQRAYLYYNIDMIMSINMRQIPFRYIFTIASLIFGCFAFIFLWVYIYEKKVFSIPFILFMFLSRLICDLFGHSFEWNMIRSFYFQSHSQGWNEGLVLFFWVLPSYLAMGDYISQKLTDVKRQS